MNKLKIIVVGYGRIGMRHVGHINNLALLGGIVEIDESRRKQAAIDHGKNCPIFKSIDEVDQNYDIAAICTPNGNHYDSAKKCLEKGISVLIEKPMTLDLMHGLNLLSIAEKKNLRVFAVKQNRFNPPVEYVKNLLLNNKLGNLLSFQINCFWNRNEDYYSTSTWKGTKKMDGGVLYTQFSHFIDLLIWLIGEMSVLSAVIKKRLVERNIEIEDTGLAILKSKSSELIGTLNYNINSYGKNMEGSITIFGSKGTIKIGGQYLNELEYFNVENEKSPSLAIGNAPNNYGTYLGSMSNHDKVYENLIDVLQNNGSISTSGIEALSSLSLIEEIYAKSKS